MKVKNGVYNIAFSLLGQAITIVLGLFIPQLLASTYGSEVNGLLTSINQIFAYFTLLEAGIGVTTLQALYKPVSSSDKPKINAILSATNKYYKKVALLYFICVIVFASSYFFLTKVTVSYFTVFGVILFSGLGNVINFSIQEKFKLLLEAEGKKYISVNAQTIIFILTNISKIICILLKLNIVLIQLFYFIINFIQVFFIYFYIKKKYKWIDLKVKPDYQAISQKNSVLVHQIASLIFANTDVLVLTFLLQDLKIVSVYSMYKLVISMIASVMNNVSSSLSFMLGQTFQKDKEQYKSLIDVYDVFFQSTGFSLFTITYIFYMPFIKLYTAKITDTNYILDYLPALFVAIELLNVMRNASLNTINVAGHFKRTQWRALLESGINLVVSIICVFKFGIYGVLFGTIVAFLYRTNDIIIYANHTILNRSATKSYGIILSNLLILFVCVFIANKIPMVNDDYLQLILHASICSAIIIPVFFIINSFIFKKESKYVVSFIKEKLAARAKKA